MPVTELQHVAGGIGRDAEQPGMAERHQPAIADQHVQAEREDGIEQDLAGDVDVIDAEHPVGQREQRHECDAEGDEARAHGTCLPNRPWGRNSSTSSMGMNRTKYASSGSSAWPKL